MGYWCGPIRVAAEIDIVDDDQGTVELIYC